jgi:hypothetical protein
MHQSMVTFETDALTIRPWPDEIIDSLGFDPRSPYVERFWLGVLGPSTTWLLRRLAAGFDEAPDGFVLPLSETARALGLGDRGGRNSPFLRTVNRMIQFELAQVVGVGNRELAVRRRLPPLGRRHLARLSPELQAAHERWQCDQLREPPEEAQRRRARQLALSLVELGEQPEDVERQLLRWRYHPALAQQSAWWAAEQHRFAVAGAAVAGAEAG